ncbi:SDR family oxidoreductase [Frigoriglobus tundricola]|uniref:Oxidoreductase, short-chain dehydrogenase/reductase family n=1 Tax=Frigoriglobus tundricola TaxID=2774151 RepID=A0A6M5YLR0_9BACT|nr:SDR family oxidoreductase [Frigoriglobus tundricola]QJW93922.1 Oxidoreductase, short-chain dehydrogenase/reductase family [Frigoriglobus tundricola]
MNPTGNTILITGGGSGIGRALAEAFHALGNRVVIAGRRRSTLAEVAAANPGMAYAELDIDDPAAVRAFAARVTAEHPALNVLINNAGIMRPEDLVSGRYDPADAEAIVATNLLGPIRLTAALLPHLRAQPRSAVVNVTSGLAFVPLAATPTYSATKAAVHSYTVSLRHQLRGTTTEVIELIPPYVQTDLTPGQASDPRAMPLVDFIAEVMRIFTTRPDATEVVVERCKPLRFAAENGSFGAVFSALNPTGSTHGH